jgi:leucyl-tRNA synthetase
MTSFAGSIGIIGIALILALSTGINAFISQVQEDTLSAYPLTLQKNTQDMAAMLAAMTNVSSTEDYRDSGKIYVDDSLGTMMSAMSSTVENNLEAFKAWRPEFATAEFVLEDGKYVCGWTVEKMSKSKFNVVNPDMIVDKYGADTLRMYEMFLGPIELSKPWDTNGVDGVHKFLRRLWRLFTMGADGEFLISDEKADAKELKALHAAIKKITADIERFSFNTCISQFMILLNELSDLKCNKREVLESVVALLSPFAPYIAEELWHALGYTTTVCDAKWPVCNEAYLVESSFTYPVSFNGKTRYMLELPADMGVKEIEATVLAHENSQKYLEGKTVKKVIIVPKKIINIVVV